MNHIRLKDIEFNSVKCIWCHLAKLVNQNFSWLRRSDPPNTLKTGNVSHTICTVTAGMLWEALIWSEARGSAAQDSRVISYKSVNFHFLTGRMGIKRPAPLSHRLCGGWRTIHVKPLVKWKQQDARVVTGSGAGTWSQLNPTWLLQAGQVTSRPEPQCFVYKMGRVHLFGLLWGLNVAAE